MVSKITIFEPHFDGAQFGPASISGEKSELDSAEPVTDEEEGRRGFSPPPTLVIAGIAVGILIGVKALRSRATDESELVTNEEQPAEAVQGE
jgi:hypothetical protein